jgi:hypothetical protein
MARVPLPQPIGDDWTLYSQDDRFGKLVAGSPLQHPAVDLFPFGIPDPRPR